MTTQPLLLTLPEVAARLGCSVSTIERRVRRREIPSVKSGGLRRVSVRDLDRYTDGMPRTEPVPDEIAEKARRAMARR